MGQHRASHGNYDLVRIKLADAGGCFHPMRRLQPVMLAVLFLWLPVAASGADVADDEIRRILIQRSLAAYPGNCPCPYNVDRAGRRCGQRSAYSKRGGYAPLCFAHDVTPQMVRDYRSAASAR